MEQLLVPVADVMRQPGLVGLTATLPEVPACTAGSRRMDRAHGSTGEAGWGLSLASLWLPCLFSKGGKPPNCHLSAAAAARPQVETARAP